MRDEFSGYFAEFLDGYFALGQGPGGFRTRWRILYGSDDLRTLNSRIAELLDSWTRGLLD